jgi:hypothetical protein
VVLNGDAAAKGVDWQWRIELHVEPADDPAQARFGIR